MSAATANGRPTDQHARLMEVVAVLVRIGIDPDPDQAAGVVRATCPSCSTPRALEVKVDDAGAWSARCTNGCEGIEDALRPEVDGEPEGDFGRLDRFRRNIVSWPQPMRPEARHGLVGRALAVIEPHSEADPHAILVSLLIAFGNAVGRGPGFQAEGDFHAVNEYGVIAGQTSKARKGTSQGRVRQLFARADPDYTEQRVKDGLSSGEGLIWEVRDKVTGSRKAKKAEALHADDDGYIQEVVDPGVDDKRLLITEGEFAQALKVMQREGNTLSVVLRNLWDRGAGGGLTKNSRTRTTQAHVSLIGNITGHELRRLLTETEAANGFANRILWVCAKRSNVLPDGGNLTEEDLQPIATELAEALHFARRLKGPLYRDDAASALWHEIYEELSDGRDGMLGAITSRAEAHVMRLAVIYAVLDQRTHVGEEHLRAALAVWDYCFHSASYLFGDTLGDPVADEILSALLSRVRTRDGMTRSEIRDLFGRHKRVDRITQALELLRSKGLARVEKESTGGRPVERWYAQVGSDESDLSDQSREGAGAS
jgi:hypothetical protein